MKYMIFVCCREDGLQCQVSFICSSHPFSMLFSAVRGRFEYLNHWDPCSMFSVAFSLWGQEFRGEKRVRLAYILPSGSCLRLLLLFSCWVLSGSPRPHELQHARLPCPSLSPGVCWNSCLLSQWYYPTISSSVTPFSSCPPSFPGLGSFPVNQFFLSGDQSIGASLSVLQWIFRADFL